jgi:type II secretory pathway pseudopilin PulG
MGIVIILAALLIGAGVGVLNQAKRNRAQAEIRAMATGLESYKIDNGIYPSSDGTLLLPTTYTTYDGTTVAYQTNANILYYALSGQTNFSTLPASGVKTYMSFKANQVGGITQYTYAADPWGYAYGYSTGTTNGASTPQAPYNGSGFFDLWSTGGVKVADLTSKPSLTNAWISNWTQ